MAGYRDRTLHIDLSELGDGCFVEIKNLALQPVDKNPRRIKLGADGSVDEADAIAATKEMLVKLIVGWTMWDVDTGDVLPLPSEDDTVLERCPQSVWVRLGQEIKDRVNPQ